LTDGGGGRVGNVLHRVKKGGRLARGVYVPAELSDSSPHTQNESLPKSFMALRKFRDNIRSRFPLILPTKSQTHTSKNSTQQAIGPSPER